MQMVKTDAKVSLKVYYIKFLNSVPNVSLLFLILTKDLDVTERKNAIEVAVADPHPATLLVHPCRNLLWQMNMNIFDLLKNKQQLANYKVTPR